MNYLNDPVKTRRASNPRQPNWMTVGDIGLELRDALEPWHVLGEEQAAGGTVRYVDSSSERVQARVTNWVPERFILAANGVAVPVQPSAARTSHSANLR